MSLFQSLLRDLFPAHREAGAEILPSEGRLPPFEGAIGWLNSEPLTPDGLRGRVVAVQFWTYTCVNWLRTLPYAREWAAKYHDHGLDRKSTRLNSSHANISYSVFCLKKKK